MIQPTRTEPGRWIGWLALSICTLATSGAVLPAVAQRYDPETAALPAGIDARLYPGDQVAVEIWREPDLGGTHTVSESGTLVLPRLGEVDVADLTAGELQTFLRRAYSEYLRDPSVEISILRRVAVHGEVRNPNLYMVDLTMTLREVIAMAGGLTPGGHPNKITLLRDGERLPLEGERASQFVTAELRSGDQIIVGRKSWLAANPWAAIGAALGALGLFFTQVLPLFRE
ncbi:MAG: polysaccharide biosynthesis/export family protein [Longimicrobiaceae bacterium]